jgi:P4 family phage/plasmid primase-like protien
MIVTEDYFYEDVTEEQVKLWQQQCEAEDKALEAFFELVHAWKKGLPVDEDELRHLVIRFLGEEAWERDFVAQWQARNQRDRKNGDSKPFKVNPDKYFDDRSRFVPVLLGQDIMENHLRVFSDGQRLYYYDNGVYHPNGEAKFREICVRLLADKWRKQYVDETLHWVMSATLVEREAINPKDNLINLKNGLLNWQTGELLPHVPERLSTIQLPVDYDPDVEDPVVMQFINSVLPKDAVDVVFEMIGYCLVPHTKYEKAIMLYGTGANGKSTFLNMLSALIGKNNISNISLQDLENNRFKLAELENKLVNIYADLPGKALRTSNNFKAIVSGDSVNAERKNKDPFDFRPFAKLIFSTNDLPRSSDLTDGYYRRWLIIPFEKKFTPDTADVKLIDKLTTPSALSTLLNYAIEGLKRLERNGKFSNSPTIAKAVAKYRATNDNIMLFVEEYCVLGENRSCPTKDLYDAYKNWCLESGLHHCGKPTFNKRLAEIYKIERKRIHGESCERWFGIDLQ